MKKLNKFFAVLVALAMMAMLCVSTAFAEQTAALEEELANARIKKIFTIPEGVIDPDIVAQFDFTPNAGQSIGLNANETLPSLTAPEVTYDGNGQQTTAAKSDTEYAALPTTTFPHAGVYAYDVAEGTTTVTTTDANYEVQKGGEQYIVRYYVKTDAQGNTYVDYITVQNKTNDGKVDSFIDSEEPNEQGYDEWSDGDDSNFAFTNVYTVNNGTDEPDPDDPNPTIDPDDAALKVTKVVNGLAAGVTDNTTFPFTINVTAAAGQESTVLKAWIIDATTGAVKNNAATPDVTITGTGSASFNLKNGEALAFVKAPAGTRYAVSETLANATDYNDYTPGYTVTSEGSAATATFTGSAGAGQTLTTAGEANVGTYLLAANKNDTAAYTNEKLDTTPTGILINNLPYIALALVAIGGLVAYVIVRRRDADEA